jgi:hypothetical protein
MPLPLWPISSLANFPRRFFYMTHPETLKG